MRWWTHQANRTDVEVPSHHPRLVEGETQNSTYTVFRLYDLRIYGLFGFISVIWSMVNPILVLNFLDIWSFRLYGQLYQDKTVDHISETRCMHCKGPSIYDVRKILRFFLPLPPVGIWDWSTVLNSRNLPSYIFFWSSPPPPSVRTSYMEAP